MYELPSENITFEGFFRRYVFGHAVSNENCVLTDDSTDVIII